MAANKEESKALVTFPQDVPQLPDLKGKIGGATIKASEDESSIAEMQKKVYAFFFFYNFILHDTLSKILDK